MHSRTTAEQPTARVDRREEDPRVAALDMAVRRLGAELNAYERTLSDRAIAEEQLAALRAMVRSGAPEVHALRAVLLMLAAALGSVSALSGPLGEVRMAVELFGAPREAR